MYVKREACLVHLVILSRDSELMIDQLVEFFMVESTHPDLNLRLNRGVRIFLDLSHHSSTQGLPSPLLELQMLPLSDESCTFRFSGLPLTNSDKAATGWPEKRTVALQKFSDSFFKLY
jgi:hypothetical protein